MSDRADNDPGATHCSVYKHITWSITPGAVHYDRIEVDLAIVG